MSDIFVIQIYLYVSTYISFSEIYIYIYIYIFVFQKDFPGGSDGKAFVYNAGDLGSIPGLGSSLQKEKAIHSSTLA